MVVGVKASWLGFRESGFWCRTERNKKTSYSECFFIRARRSQRTSIFVTLVPLGMRRLAATTMSFARALTPALTTGLTAARPLAAAQVPPGAAAAWRAPPFARNASTMRVVAAARRPTVGFLEAAEESESDENELEASVPETVPADAPTLAALSCARRALGRSRVTAADMSLAHALTAAGVATAGDLAALTAERAAQLGLPADVAAAVKTVLVAAAPAPRRRRAAPAPATARTTTSVRRPATNSDSLIGVAATSADRFIVAPPTDPCWADRAGETPPPVEPAVRAILARRLPRIDRFFHGSGQHVYVTRRGQEEGRPSVYKLAPSATPPALAKELASFIRFWTVRFPGQQQPPIARVTASKYEDVLRRVLGWCVEFKGMDASTLSLATIIPSPDRGGAALAMEYAAWLATDRGVTPHTEGLAVRALLAAAKCVHHSASTASPADGDKPYTDLPVVRELRAMSRAATAASRRSPRVADERAKWLEWGEYLDLVAELRTECAGLEGRGRARTPASVAWSLQKYLMFAILACVPDRQRTLRELEVGRTLFFRNGRWEIRHGPSDYKTGRAYGDRPPLLLAPALNDELGAYLSTWRAALAPNHRFVFTSKHGEPLTGQAVHRIFERASFRITGKKLNPHLVRDMIVTHLRGRGDASERELEALALYMGHSLDMQRSTYDRRTVADKVEPAVALLERLGDRENLK